jgi:phage tail sheath gpL-like
MQGNARVPVQFREVSSGRVSRANPDPKTGRFRVTLSASEYELTAGAQKRLVTVLPGESYSLRLAAENSLDMRVTTAAATAGVVTIRVALSGSGDHTIAIRTDNLSAEPSSRKITLRPGTPQTIEWQARREAVDAPWVAVVIPDNDLSDRKEVTGK